MQTKFLLSIEPPVWTGFVSNLAQRLLSHPRFQLPLLFLASRCILHFGILLPCFRLTAESRILLVHLKATFHSEEFSARSDIFFCLTLSSPGGGGAKYSPPVFLHHPKTAQINKLKLSDFKDTLLRHILQVKPVR